MKIPYFCCIGAELKRYAKDFDFMNQVYLYKVPTDDTIEEVFAEDYFKAISDSVLQDDIVYIYEASAETLHECRFDKQNGHITAVQLANNVPGLTPNRVLISDSTGHITAGDVTLEYLKNKVNLDGTSIMTGPLKFRAGSFSGAIAGGLGDGVSIYKLKADGSIDSEVASLTKTNGFTPGTTNTQNIGSPTLKWKDAHVARVITGIINNGYDIAVPVTNSADTLALKSEVDNAANSGDQLYATGVWYAKMYAASVVPTGAEYDGKNYADFSQTDSGGNPVIKIYTGASGAWTLTDTITPPADYNGYMTITSKIWDIAEQAGQQGGKVLWSHNQRTFTPYPQIISFENAALTGTPTAPLPTSDSPNDQIATKEYVDNASPSGVYHPGLFAHEWDDHIRYDASWLRANTFSWQSGAVYQAAYQHLTADITGKTLQSETISGTTIQFYLADDGHKICPANQESNVTAIYNATGVAWYYIIDTTNQRFKLPRAKHRKLVGININYNNGTSISTNTNFTCPSDGLVFISHYGTSGTGTLTVNSRSFSYFQSVGAGSRGCVSLPVSKGTVVKYNLGSGVFYPEIKQEEETDQYKYLYFYVGQFTQTALENTAGLNAELFNGKADTDLSNVLANIDFVVESQLPTAANNYTWYRKYKSGWVEQGGSESASNTSINLPIAMANTHYTATITANITSEISQTMAIQIAEKTATTLKAVSFEAGGYTVNWQVSGMAAN